MTSHGAAVDFIFRPLLGIGDTDPSEYAEATIERRLKARPNRLAWRLLAALADRSYAAVRPCRPGAVLVLRSSRYFHFVDALRRITDVVVMVKGMADRRLCGVRGLPMVPAHEWATGLLGAYVSKTGRARAEAVEKTLDSIRRTLDALRPRLVMAFGSGPFVDRAVALIAKERRCQVVSLQHGLYSRHEFDPAGVDRGFTDRWLVWGAYYRRLCESLGIDADRVRVIGYPFAVPKALRARATHSICYLGQPWDGVNQSLGATQIRIVHGMLEACRASGIDFHYRPHPREDRRRVSEFIPSSRMTPANETLEQTFIRHDVFASISSTALVEAALRGRLAAQVLPSGSDSVIVVESGVHRVGDDAGDLRAFVRGACSGELRPCAVHRDFIDIPSDLSVALAGVVRDYGAPAVQ